MFVRTHIWDKQHKLHKDKIAVEAMWNIIAKEVDLDLGIEVTHFRNSTQEVKMLPFTSER